MKLLFAAALAATALAAPAMAQTAPDGSPAFGIKPYIGVLGGIHSYDRSALSSPQSGRFYGEVIEGVGGINIPLGPVFVGAEGHVARGFRDIEWEYGAKGRAGFRAGDSGLIFASAGYKWIEPRNDRGFTSQKGWVYGIGAEVGPRDIGLGGITSSAGPRIRLQVETMNFDSIRPMAGVIFHF
jgi:opacity protein-like surface antigen